MGQRSSRSSRCKSSPTRLPLPWALWQEIALLLDINDIAMFARVCREAASNHRREPMSPLELDLTNRVFSGGKSPVPPNLARWTRLKVLDLWAGGVNIFAPEGCLPNLREADLGDLEYPADLLPWLSGHETLRSLRVSTITDESLGVLSQLHRLQVLEVLDAGLVTPDALEHLAGFTQLRRLELVDLDLVVGGSLGPGTSAALRHLSRLKSLESLRLEPCPLFVADLRRLFDSLPNLSELDCPPVLTQKLF